MTKNVTMSLKKWSTFMTCMSSNVMLFGKLYENDLRKLDSNVTFYDNLKQELFDILSAPQYVVLAAP